MKLINYKIATLLLCIPFLVFSNGIKGKYKKSKTISNKFEVNSNSVLNIKNKFGNVDIATWNQNKVEIEILITVSGNDEEKLENQLDKIFIDFDQSGENVYATTHVKKLKSNSWFSGSWFSWGSNSNVNIQIDYKVKMPISNDLNITNDYGGIVLDELNGKANIHCDFGKLTVGRLNNTHNEIHFDYTKHSNFEFIEKADIYADFSGFTVEKAKEITLEGDYSSSTFLSVDKLNYNCDFGSVKVEKVTTVKGEGDYASLHFGDVYKSVSINASFGSLKINELKEGFEKVTIDADYTGVKIGINSEASCNIKADLSFGSFRYDGDEFNFNIIKEKSTKKYYEGYFNNKNTNANITTNTEFGSVKFYQK